MVRSGERKLNNYSVPLAFEGHYFILESGAFPQISVIREFEGRPIFEVSRNKPMVHPLSETSEDAVGIVSVFDKQTSRFLYIIRPGLETNVVLGKTDGGAISVKIMDDRIHVSGDTIHNCVFNGVATTICVDYQGCLSIEAPRIPPAMLQLLAIN